MASFLTGERVEDDPMAAPFLEDVTVPYVVLEPTLRRTLPLTRAAIGLRLAQAEHALDDPESAYALLLDLPEDRLVAAAQAHAATVLDWPSRAVQAAQRALSLGEDPDAWVELVAARALALAGAHDRSLECAVRAVAAAREAGTSDLENQARFVHAQAAHALGDDDTAWEELLRLARLEPPISGVQELLKEL